MAVSFRGNLSRLAAVLVTLLVCITQEIFVILELWEPCRNQVNFHTYADGNQFILLPAFSIGLPTEDYLDYVLTNPHNESHHLRPGQAKGSIRQTIKDNMLDCIVRTKNTVNMTCDCQRFKWYKRCIFSTSHQLNISVYELFDSLLLGDWSHDHLFRITASPEHMKRQKIWLRSTQGYLGRYMLWTFFTESGMTRYTTDELIYSQTSGVKGNVFNSYIPLASEMDLILTNANQSLAEKNLFNYTYLIHSPAMLLSGTLDDEDDQLWYDWYSWRDKEFLTLTVSYDIIRQKTCMSPLHGNHPLRGNDRRLCRDYFPSLAADEESHCSTSDESYQNTAEDLHRGVIPDGDHLKCSFDPSLACYTPQECEFLFKFQNPGYTCLQDSIFTGLVPFHHLKSILSNASKGVACVDPQDGSPSDADEEARHDYWLNNISVDMCPRACNVPVHRIQKPYNEDLTPDGPPKLNFIIRTAKETFLTVEMNPPTTWVQLVVNIFAVAGTWFGLSVYGGIMTVPVWLSASWKYVTERGIKAQQDHIIRALTSFTANFINLVCCFNCYYFVELFITIPNTH